jgi:siroheme synthase
MGMNRLRSIARGLLDAGADPDLPAAVVENGTLSTQRVVVATLGTLVDEILNAGLGSPAVIVFGEVVRLRDKAAWFEPAEGADGEPQERSLP